MITRTTIAGTIIFLMSLFVVTDEPFAQGSFVDEYLHPEMQKTVSLDFQGAPLTSVLKILSQQTGMNFVASDTVATKTINVYLDNVGVWDALEHILTINGLTYELQSGSNIFTVKELVTPAHELVTRVYQLNHIPVPSHLMNSMLTFEDSIGGGGGGGGGGGAESERTTAEDGIVAAIGSVLSENGSIVEDTRTNSLIITDHPSQFGLIESTIARLDIRVPQILIEAEMLDVSEGTSEQLGVKHSDTLMNLTQGATKQGLFPFDEKDPNAFGLGNATYTAPSILTFSRYNFVVNFLRGQSDTRNLARPRILTLNNQTASISIRTDEAVGVSTENTTTGEGGGSTTEEAEREETGVFLKVTPYANVLTREITMAIEPRAVEARENPTFPQFRDPEERGTKSILRILDGDTIIIGGLLRSDSSDTHTTVPIVGNIPILGAAFRHKEGRGSQRELIVFITPHILDEHQASASRNSQRGEISREQDQAGDPRWARVNEDLMMNERYK